jgi:uncharacterized membrane protein YedE/YeeE
MSRLEEKESVMLLENFDWGLEARTLQVLFALGLGIVLGAAAQVTRFCLRRAIVGEGRDRGQAAAVWATAFTVGIIAFFGASAAGYVDLDGHRYLNADVPVLGIVLGGLAFGAGMILTRGCASRLTVLAATGNMRAMLVLVLFATVAHATLKGGLAPLRTSLGSVTSNLPFGTLYAAPFAAPLVAALALLGAGYLVYRFRPSVVHIALGAVIGLIPVLGWATTSVLLFDDFDPLEVQSAAFTLPWSDTLFWLLASSAIPAGFGTGLMGGVLLGSFLSASVRGELKLQSFDSPVQTLRYGAGAVLMGVGGVLAGGCTIGAGLSGSATLSMSALLALGSIIAGGYLANRFEGRVPQGVPAT